MDADSMVIECVFSVSFVTLPWKFQSTHSIHTIVSNNNNNKKKFIHKTRNKIV